MSDIPKKKATVVGKSKLPLCLALTAAFAAVYFYVALPAINLHDESFYTFFLLCVGVFCVLTLITGCLTAVCYPLFQENDDPEYLLSQQPRPTEPPPIYYI